MFKPSRFLIVGGDGWAYDMGYGGLDHVIGPGTAGHDLEECVCGQHLCARARSAGGASAH